MLILWFMSTREHPQVVVTANTSHAAERRRPGASWRSGTSCDQQPLVPLDRHQVPARALPGNVVRRRRAVDQGQLGKLRRHAREARARDLRRGLGHRRQDLGSDRGRDDHARRHVDRLRQPDAEHRPLRAVLRQVQAPLDHPADRQPHRQDGQQGADRSGSTTTARTTTSCACACAASSRGPAPAVHQPGARGQRDAPQGRGLPAVRQGHGVDVARHGDDQSVDHAARQANHVWPQALRIPT
jgi:hypothetical protein